MGYDEVIPHLGEFGRYQKRIYFLLCLPAISCAFHKLSAVFLQAKPDYRCELPSEYSNSTYNLTPEAWNKSIPFDSKYNKYSTCTYYDANRTVEYCTEFIYDRSKYQSSTVIEWDMVCDKAYMKATTDSLFMLGVMLGSIIFGDLSDRYGRKPIFFASLVLQVIFGVLAAVSPEYWTYTLSRLVVGATTSGVFLVAYVIAMEMVGPSKRLFAGTICQMFFSLGYMLVAAFAYYIRNWRELQIALTLPGLVFFCYWWFIPESTRWLLLQKRFVEARNAVRKVATENKVEISDETIDALLKTSESNSTPDEKKASLLDIFKYPNLRKRSLLIFFDWFANSITYYGLSWNTSNLGGNDFINFVISGAVEIPAYTFLLLTLNRWGRKSILCGCMLTAGLSLLVTMAVYDKPAVVVTLAMVGKLAITASYGTIYIFSTEQFPTVIRNVGLGACSTSARVGSILAPIINLSSEVWQPLPLIIFGGLALIGGLLSLLLPETLNKQLPESIADGEQFGLKKDNKSEEMVTIKEKSNPEEILKFIEANEKPHQNGTTALIEDVEKNT